MNNSSNGINCEHTWPRSKGADSGNPPLSDMHHLFPTRAGVNTARDNFPYGEIPDAVTTKWYRLDQELTAIPTDHLNEYSERTTGRFEPREDHKGNPDSYRDVPCSISTPCTSHRRTLPIRHSFHSSGKPSAAGPARPRRLPIAIGIEIARTWLIAAQQDGKPNPYVIDCSLAPRTFCSDLPAICEIETTAAAERLPAAAELSISPNPATGDIRIDAPFDSARLSIADLAGRLMLSCTWSADETVATDALPVGMYFVFLTSGKGRIAGRVVKQ